MGTDIHVQVERLEGDKWTWLEPPERLLFDDYRIKEWFGTRNYNLFAMLANVRNGSGFAGCDTGDPVVPIDMPRGFPEDASPETRNEWNEDWYHDTSYFTLRELQLVDWNQEIIHRGIVSAKEYEHYLEHDSPDDWCGGISGGNIRIITGSEMRMRLHGPAREQVLRPQFGELQYYTKIQWTTTWREAVYDEWFEFLDQLGKLTLDDGTDIRVIFWFDS